ncbi:MAG: CapA family protein [Clostridia bacterium]|nr:CapA family protein [Clostridia bacterium]
MKKIIISLIILIVVLLTIPPLISTFRQSLPAISDAEMTDGKGDEPDGTFDIVMHFSGDVLIAENLDAGRAGGFNEYANRESCDYFLKNAIPYFENDDYTVVNLENVLSDRALSPATKPLPAYWFKSKTANTGILTASSVECVSIANNHTRDYGAEGLADTISALEGAGIEYGTDSKTVYFEKNGFKTAIICSCMWNRSWADGIIKRVKEAEAQSDFQIVFFHGGKEAEHTPEPWKIDACHALVDNGADIVVGAHPHVLQRTESYSGAKIVYSLGNFCFGGNRSPENRTALYRLTITVNDADKSFTHSSAIIPFYVYTGGTNNYQPDVIRDAETAQRVLKYMKGELDRPY